RFADPLFTVPLLESIQVCLERDAFARQGAGHREVSTEIVHFFVTHEDIWMLRQKIVHRGGTALWRTHYEEVWPCHRSSPRISQLELQLERALTRMMDAVSQRRKKRGVPS